MELLVLSLGNAPAIVAPPHKNPNSISLKNPTSPSFLNFTQNRRCQRPCSVTNGSEKEPELTSAQEQEVDNLGVKAALSTLRFYKREISPLLPNSCRYVPTCSEYSMIAYKKYGVVKGTILTAWRLCRCNPLGGSGFDPPRWFGEKNTLNE